MAERDYFRESFNYFKKRNETEVLNNVLDLDCAAMNECVVSHLAVGSDILSCSECEKLGLLSHQKWNVRSLKGLEGFFHIRNPFTDPGQIIWIKKCLDVYPLKPSVTNLDSLGHQLRVKFSDFSEKLSWVTFGFHHNWDTKVYDRTNYSPFPECLASLSKHIASCMGFGTFMPEAAIVNYYNKKSSLGIHNDHSEEAIDQPIISLSLGQTAIFLIGTSLRADKPKSILLKSGDIVMMSGESRLSYHAVPNIILNPPTIRYSFFDKSNSEDFYHKYMENHRINISIRQVYSQKNNSSVNMNV